MRTTTGNTESIHVNFIHNPGKIKNKTLHELYARAKKEADGAGIIWVEAEYDGEYL